MRQVEIATDTQRALEPWCQWTLAQDIAREVARLYEALGPRGLLAALRSIKTSGRA
jgi:hypothetical protein